MGLWSALKSLVKGRPMQSQVPREDPVVPKDYGTKPLRTQAIMTVSLGPTSTYKNLPGVLSQSPKPTIPDSLFIEPHRTLPISYDPFAQIQGIPADVRQHLENAFRDGKGATLLELRERAGLILWGYAYQWPACDEWDARFAQQQRWPAMWDHEESEEEEEGSEESPVSSGYSQPLPAKLAALSIEARQLLWQFRGYSQTTTDQVVRHSTPAATQELARYGLLVPVTDVGEILATLPLYRLREVQKQHGLRGGRSRVEVARILTEKLDEQAISAVVKDFAPVHIGDPQWRSLMPSQMESAKLIALTHTLSMEVMREYHWESYFTNGVKQVKAMGAGDTDCLECKRRNGKRIRLTTITDLPPFHPGCRCTTLACLD